MALLLLTPTNRTIVGPTFSLNDGMLVVDYDCERDDGTIANGRIQFEDVLSCQFWDGSCSPADVVIGASECRVLENSGLLEEVVNRWVETVGWCEWQERRIGRNAFRHFTVYFDNAGALEVVAAKCRIER